MARKSLDRIAEEQAWLARFGEPYAPARYVTTYPDDGGEIILPAPGTPVNVWTRYAGPTRCVFVSWRGARVHVIGMEDGKSVIIPAKDLERIEIAP